MNVSVPAAAPPSYLDAEPTSGGISIVALVEALIVLARERGASDLHLDPQEGRFVVRLRIDGALEDVRELPARLQPEIIARVKILAGLRTDEHQAAQDGRFRSAVAGGAPIDVRVSIVPTYYGENAVLRLLAPLAAAGTLAALGFSPEHEALVAAAIARPNGLLLVTGPTGSGKTSTLYTLLKLLNTRTKNILTIEDPVEYSIEGINQIQANPRAGLTFENGLRSMLRQDPDVLMVGEIRDTPTASIATNIALTGHLVLSTLHTNDAPSAILRLLDMRIEPYVLASTVTLVIAQRLIRTICSECKEERTLSGSERRSLAQVFDDQKLTTASSFYGRGCAACSGSGYRGRTGVFEVCPTTPDLRDAMLRRAPAAELRAIATGGGMAPMISDGFRKALAGMTTLDEVLRVRHE
jgi:type II secretory ATPase GspE/PulE/Tfp pilus assembly ATPase PilB-like protein